MAEYLADKTVEQEIERLKQSEAVKLALREKRYKRQHEHYLNTLRWCVQRGKDLTSTDIDVEMRKYHQIQRLTILRFYEQKGRELMSQGITEETMPDLILDSTKVRCER